eukprot:12762585-Alexandrium_andersonii.AAC.1
MCLNTAKRCPESTRASKNSAGRPCEVRARPTSRAGASGPRPGSLKPSPSPMWGFNTCCESR